MCIVFYFGQGEIQKVLQMGVDQSRIIYANPCKAASHIRYAARVNVPLMTFDNETELHKVKAYYPQAKYVLEVALCVLGVGDGMAREVNGVIRVWKES